MGPLLAFDPSDIVSALAGLLVGWAATFNYYRNNRASGASNITDQSKATAGGDIVAGNKTSRR